MTLPGAGLLRAWRVRKGWMQAAAAKAFGVSQPSWSCWESGKVPPARDLAILLEDFTDGAVPIEAWSADPAVAAAMHSIVLRRVGQRDNAARTRRARARSIASAAAPVVRRVTRAR